jgi:hypothetical protein
MSRRLCWRAGVLLIAGIAGTVAFAQAPRPLLPEQPTQHTQAAPWYYPTGADGAREQVQAAQLAKQLIKAEKADEKEKLRKEMTELLGKQFDAHLQQQQKGLEALEKQIADLKAIVKKRQDAKASIVERRMNQLVDEAQGLGWNVPSTPRPVTGFGGYSASPGFPGGVHTAPPKDLIPAKK